VRRWDGSRARVALGGIVLLAVATRLAAIGGRLHADDAYSWLVASQPSPHAFLRQLAGAENTPLLSYLLLSPLPIDQPVWLRLPAAVAGSLLPLVLFLAVRRAIGTRASLIAALAVAVAPFLITYSNLARGFMLQDLAELVALWAVLALAEESRARWWAAFVLAGVVALYTEYSAAIFLAALAAVAVALGRPRRRPMVLATAVPFVALAPWIPQIARGERQVGVTKLHPLFATPSPHELRDAVATLTFGENGGTSSSLGRWLVLAVMLALAAAVAFVLRRGWPERSERCRRVILLVSATAGLTLLGHAAGALVGVDVFTQRYMTVLIPLAAVPAACALASVSRPRLVVMVSLVLVILGVTEVARRFRAEYEPDFTPVRAAATAAHARTVLTDSPIVLFYLHGLRPQYDRPFNLGPDRSGSCARPCLVIDDLRVLGGSPRRVTGTRTMLSGRYVLTLER